MNLFVHAHYMSLCEIRDVMSIGHSSKLENILEMVNMPQLEHPHGNLLYGLPRLLPMKESLDSFSCTLSVPASLLI